MPASAASTYIVGRGKEIMSLFIDVYHVTWLDKSSGKVVGHKRIRTQAQRRSFVYKEISNYICNYACLITLHEVFRERKVRHNAYLTYMNEFRVSTLAPPK
jgi:hypothetical protein|uniref:Uncharacterized protein n=1 Tax=Picea sitchensis TaxID=3332 RepID=A0A6B9XV65_PICSI|nr:hypothetical protein Q903MT_gene4178 [Picea sitchensis]